MKITNQTINFKGYDAAPLKNVFYERTYCSPISKELMQIAKEEGFGVRAINDKLKWAQDRKAIVEKQGKSECVIPYDISLVTRIEMQPHGINTRRASGFLIGGNSYIGKYPNGEKWIIAGNDEFNCRTKKQDVSKDYNVKPENIHFIRQQDFHIDMFLRPVGYPYILVNDPKIARENLEQLSDVDEDQKEELINFFDEYQRIKQQKLYCSCDETCDKLAELGFIPLRVGAVYGGGINFMNAIVNKHDDGTMSYITNSSVNERNPVAAKLQEKFENDIKNLVPNLNKVYFVKGGMMESSGLNYMQNNIYYSSGGLHCMTMEEPNFQKWV